MMNVASGGTLYGDIPTEIGTEVIHRNNGEVYHKVALCDTSTLIFPIDTDTIMVNSWHHQGLNIMPNHLRVIARSFDGLAEAIVSKTGSVIATKDVSLCVDIARHDEEMDRLHRELFTIVLSSSWKYGVEEAIDVTLLSRFYERYADHAVSVSKRVVTIVTGEPYVAVSLTN